MLISERLKKLRKDRKMTMEEVANRMNTTKQNIYKYEHGKIDNMPLSRIEQYARIFHVPPSYIMGWDENKQDDLLNLWNRLNDEGKNKLLDYADDLIQSKKYTENNISEVV